MTNLLIIRKPASLASIALPTGDDKRQLVDKAVAESSKKGDGVYTKSKVAPGVYSIRRQSIVSRTAERLVHSVQTALVMPL